MALTPEEADRIEQLFRKMYGMLLVYADSIIGPNLAEDAVQDSFRIACGNAKKLWESPNPRGWMVNALKNVLWNMIRSRARLYRLMATTLPPEAIAPAGLDTAELDLWYGDLIAPEDYYLLKLVVLERRSMREAAEALHISVEACKKRLQRAKKAMKKKLKELED